MRCVAAGHERTIRKVNVTRYWCLLVLLSVSFLAPLFLMPHLQCHCSPGFCSCLRATGGLNLSAQFGVILGRIGVKKRKEKK
jgi:hypothetical protein